MGSRGRAERVGWAVCTCTAPPQLKSPAGLGWGWEVRTGRALSLPDQLFPVLLAVCARRVRWGMGAPATDTCSMRYGKPTRWA